MQRTFHIRLKLGCLSDYFCPFSIRCLLYAQIATRVGGQLFRSLVVLCCVSGLKQTSNIIEQKIKKNI